MDFFDILENNTLDNLDPDGGVLSLTLSWRPQPDDPLPELPGQKLSTLIYQPIQAEDPCPCGSNDHFGACCQQLSYWRPVCPDPDMQRYSLLRPQSALFTSIPDDKIYAFLQDDERLHCVDDTSQDAMWLYWGDPPCESPMIGIYCFGDFALKKDHTLEITALSDTRMRVLLDLLHPLELGTPQMKRELPPYVEKPARKSPYSKRRKKRTFSSSTTNPSC